jgi:hypothetical protein
MSSNETAEFCEKHLRDAIDAISKRGDLYHEIVFAKGGERQIMVLVPFGPTRAVQAAAQAISERRPSESCDDLA